METLFRICFFMAMMRFSAAEELKRNLNGVVGGNVTFPDPVLELGFLLGGRGTIALVNDRKLQIVEEIYTNKLNWNRNSGLFTITDLQKNDSGVYKVDSKKARVFYISYNLTVYDGAPTPAVETLTVSSDSCWLLCSVDKATSLLWYKDQEVQNQNSSASSLPITVHKEDRDSSYRCVAANPAENKTLHVNVRTACGFNETESGDNPKQRAYWSVIPAAIALIIGALVVWRVKRRLSEKRQTEDYAEVQINNENPQDGTFATSAESSDHFDSTVYSKLKLPEVTSAEPDLQATPT
ncbi:CD48 antigen-like isoform X1 [Fundulus heteroclitus]|uniref:CD48 antigen-like isoform X1 n=1 Tax=Fundulus heteroclitus TaxID=8078 RepID=UPI00165B5632|nr:CD48 antigen-like isoform X1 [Fundulus heteroclitus]